MSKLNQMIAIRVSRADRDRLLELARRTERTPSQVLRLLLKMADVGDLPDVTVRLGGGKEAGHD